MESTVTPWMDLYSNSIIASISIILGILVLKRFQTIWKYVFGGLTNKKMHYDLGKNFRLARNRNISAMVLSLPFCLAVSRYELYKPEFLNLIPRELQTLAVIAVFTSYLFLRFLLIHRKYRALSRDSQLSSSRVMSNYFIVLVFFMLATLVAVSAFDLQDSTVRTILLSETAFFYLLFLMRKMDFLSPGNHLVTAFLYLCTSEIVPAAALVATEVLL